MAHVCLTVLFCFALPFGAIGDCPTGCPAKCPDQTGVQSEWVKANFTLDKFWGTFYELQYHDNTQPGLMSCQRSVKSLNSDGQTYKDLFSLHIFGKSNAICDLEFNISSQPGVFLGHWRGWFRPDLHNINNTVIDVGVSANGTYEWTLEFQCADNAKGIEFAAINFYHKLPLVSDDVVPAMEERARARGLDWLLKLGTTKPNQKVCVENGYYPSTHASPSMCGQSGVLV